MLGQSAQVDILALQLPLGIMGQVKHRGNEIIML